jgi:hypothetical protein
MATLARRARRALDLIGLELSYLLEDTRHIMRRRP